MATNTQVKAQIDVDITNKTTVASITPLNVGTNMKTIVDYIDQEINDVELIQGPVGIPGLTGSAGPQGVAGPVGPAGLNWQGSWDLDASYVADDAVGYDGASYFCILAINTVLNPAPDEDITHWALLASQGSPGPQGAQGTPGIGANYTEESRNTNSLSSAVNPLILSSKITKTFTRAYVSNASDIYLGLSNIGKVTGEFFVVQNKSTTLNLVVVPLDNTTFRQPNGLDSQINFTLETNRYARFTLTETTSGSDKVFMVEVINPLGANSGTQIPTTENLISNTNSAPFPYSTATFAQFPSTFSYALPPTPALGEVRYIKTAFSNCTLYASPNPGNDGANNNFYTPTGNGNGSMQLVASKSYRFTYIGRYGATFGFWTAEIMNNI